MDAPVLCIFQFLKNRTIQWLTNAEHKALASVNDWTVTG
jgi:hypothetical protein